MINDIRLLDYVKDYEMEDFKKNNCNTNKKVTKPISLKEMKNNSINKNIDKTPINLNDFKNDLNKNNKSKKMFEEIMNDIKSKEQELKNKFNNGLIQYEEYNYYMNELSKSKEKARKIINQNI